MSTGPSQYVKITWALKVGADILQGLNVVQHECSLASLILSIVDHVCSNASLPSQPASFSAPAPGWLEKW